MRPLMLTLARDDALAYLRSTLIEWGTFKRADYPWRSTNNLWHRLVAEVMLQRTNAQQVLGTYIEFVERYPTPAAFVADEEARIFENLGLHWREPIFRELSHAIAELGYIPDEREALLLLPGIGDYIASAYRSLHRGLRDVIIDANVVRLYGRYFGFDTDGETRRKRWFRDLANQVTPLEQHRVFNYGLIDFTREVCRTWPKCDTCSATGYCEFFRLTIPK